MLARHKDVLYKLGAIVVNGFGDDTNLSNMMLESLKKCICLRYDINETRRPYLAMPFNARIAFDGTSVPVVVISQ